MPDSINTAWLLVCAAMVFLMQAGFLCLESGLTRTKNNINVALKNLADLGVSTLILWGVSYGLIFGASIGGFFGSSLFLPSFDSNNHFEISFFIYQALFCGTAVTIVSGATAERMYFGSYIICAILVSGLIYPLCAHAIWNGALTGSPDGFLGRMGFVDFAGSTAVHSVGGWVSLALLLIIGARKGVFVKEGETEAKMNGSNLPMAMLGIILLWFGWFGFNGGSYFKFSDGVPAVLLNTLLGGAAGVGMACALSAMLHKRVRVVDVMTGCLAGLVGITAGAHVFSTTAALITGAISAALGIAVGLLLKRLKIDDAVEAIPAHLAGGIWGTLAVALFGDLELMGASSRLTQLGIQATGIAYTAAIAFGIAFIFFKILNRFKPIRVDEEAERQGLNISEHNAATDFHDLFVGMTKHSNLKDLSQRIPEEPFTEAGMVANMYNRVMGALEGAVHHTHTVVNTAMDGIVTLSGSELKITSVNPAGELILGRQSNTLLGSELGEHFKISAEKNSAPIGLPDVIGRLTNGGTQLGLWARSVGGESFPIEIAITRAAEVSGDFYVGVFRDVSARYEAEQKLIRARDEAEEASRSKSQFLANMSHELRTPLNAIIGYSEMLGDDVENIEEAEVMCEDLNTINRAGHHLLSLINDILDISKIEAGKMEKHIETFSLANLLDDVLTTMAPKFQERKNRSVKRFTAEDLGEIEADAIKLRQIMLNLCSNAAKFTKAGLVEVAAARYTDPEKGGEWIHLRVSDTGIGMTSDQLGKVFDAFTQASAGTTKEYGGTGLGLTITNAFVHLLGGSITVQSEPGVGSAFNVFLPTSQSPLPNQPPGQGEQSNRTGSGPLVMTIDDDPVTHDLIQRSVVQHGYSTVSCANGSEALQTLETCKPTLIFLDLIMPDIDGMTLLTQIRQNPTWQDIPVVVLSIAADEPAKLRSLEAANSILLKPTTPTKILEVTKKLAPIHAAPNNRAVSEGGVALES